MVGAPSLLALLVQKVPILTHRAPPGQAPAAPSNAALQKREEGKRFSRPGGAGAQAASADGARGAAGLLRAPLWCVGGSSAHTACTTDGGGGGGGGGGVTL
jgi:hypothetical protein